VFDGLLEDAVKANEDRMHAGLAMLCTHLFRPEAAAGERAHFIYGAGPILQKRASSGGMIHILLRGLFPSKTVSGELVQSHGRAKDLLSWRLRNPVHEV
jgi:hypothetical protein